MVELRILGSPSLLGREGQDVRSVVHQPRRLALLSYLTLSACGTYLRRDKLLAMFWPRSPEKKARSSLSEALSRLRKSLGEDVIVTRGSNEVGVAADAIWCDVLELRRAVDESRWSAVAELYQGPLLDGLLLDGLPDFEQWFALQSGHLARTALDALGRLSDAAIAEGDDSAHIWAERALQLDPLDSGAARRVMWVLASSGHRAAALEVYDDFEARLQRERGMAASSETVELMRRIKAGWLDGEPAAPKNPESTIATNGDPVERRPPRNSSPPVPDRTSGRWRPRRLAVTTAAVAVIAFAIAAALRPNRAPAVLRYSLALPESEALDQRTVRPRIALSPDGSRLLYVGASETGVSQLWLRPRDELVGSALSGTQGATNPFFSPDGSHFGYVRDRSSGGTPAVLIASLSGGAPFELVDTAVGLAGAAWGEDNNIYYDGITGAGTTGVMRVPAAGGPPEQITVVDTAKGETDHVWPSVLPGARGLLVTILRGSSRLENADVAVVDLRTGARQVLVRAITARYAASGHLIFVRANGSMAAVAFDADRMELQGEAVDLADGLSVRLNGSVDFALSTPGTLAYVAGTQTAEPKELAWVDRDGNIELVEPGWFQNFVNVALSPDGTELAVSFTPGGWAGVQDVYIKELPGGPLSRLTLVSPALNHRAAWSPDGHSVTFVSDRSGQRALYQRASGAGPAKLLLERTGPVSDAFYTPDGRWLVYVEDRDIFAIRVGAEREPHTLVATPAVESLPAVSPDGRWLAYTSDESGQQEVYVSPFPNTGDSRRSISAGGGVGPKWAHSGGELFYKTPTGQLIAMEVRPGDNFEVGEPRVVYSATNLLGWAGGRNYAIAPDDQRILIIRPRGDASQDELIVNEGFFELLEATGPR